MRIVFFGTPFFAAEILRFLKEAGEDVVAIVTRPDKPKGRSKKLAPSAVKAFAQENFPAIPIFSPEKASTSEFAEILKGFEPDFFIVVAYGEIIKQNLLEIPKKLCLNVHASLLPKYRGAAPIQRALMAGERETGVTIIEMALKMDAGYMLEKSKVEIGENESFGELEKKLIDISGPALLHVLKKSQTNTLQKEPQNEEEVTFAQKITPLDRLIDWNRSANELHNQIRALAPQPGAFTFVLHNGQKKRMVIRKVRKDLKQTAQPGQTLCLDPPGWLVGCKEGALSLKEIQLEGKRVMTVEEFARGTVKFPEIALA